MLTLKHNVVAAIAAGLFSLPLMSGAQAKEAKAAPAAHKAIYNTTRMPSTAPQTANEGLNQKDFALPFAPDYHGSNGG
ncbi:MAG: hypothetical protein WBD95_23225 [Xanthobacteraceae bacterium]